MNVSIPTVRAPDYDFGGAVSSNRLVGLWRLMHGYHLLYIGATLSMGLAALLKTATYMLLAYLIDDVLPGQNPATMLPLIAGGFIGLALLEGTFTFLSRRTASQSAEGIVVRLRNHLYDHIQRLSFSYHDRAQTGDLLQRSTSDVDAIRRFFADQAIMAGRIVLLFGVNLAALLQLNTRLALYSIVVIPLVVVSSFFFFKRVSKAYEEYQSQEASLSTALQENLSGMRVVKAFARQAYERDKFDRENASQFRRGRHLLTMHAFYWPLADILCGMQMLAGYLIGALMTLNGEITIGTYLAYSGLVVWLIWPMRNLGRIIVDMSTGLVSYDRVAEILRQAREPLEDGIHKPHSTLKGEVVFDDVSFHYDDGTPVLHNISFHARPGQAIALLGSTGSGKTSLVNLLPRFYEYTGGKILLDGVELAEYSRDFLRQHIGIVEQEPFLFSRSIRDNITYGVGRAVTDEEVHAAARAAAIHDVVMGFPDGYSTLVGERGVTLSGGQKQRVAIARTLLKNPRILIMDDATSSVDTETEASIREALANLMKGRTTFIIAHRIQSVMDADLILVLDHGRIVQQGTHEELLAQDGIYRRVYDVQASIEDELEKEITGVGA
ncbi:MAG: ABC transporter ATP-binding protein [Anaerolineae bacterium]